MGTGISPISLALRDAGAAFGSLLESEARRRDQALTRELALGELALRGTQAAQQGKLEEARVGVSLAEAGARGRFQQLEHERGEQQLGILRDAEARAERARLWTEAHQAAQLEELRKFHAGSLANQATQAKASLLQAEKAGAYYDVLKKKTIQEMTEGGRLVPVKPLFGQVQEALKGIASTPEQAEQLNAQFRAMATTFFGHLDNFAKDPTTGEPVVTQRQGQELAAYVTPFWRTLEAVVTGKKAIPTMEEISQLTLKMYMDLPQEQKAILSYHQFAPPVMAQIRNPQKFVEGLVLMNQELQTRVLPALENNLLTQLNLPLADAKGNRTPIPQETPAEIARYKRMVTDPYNNRMRQMLLDMSHGILAPDMGQTTTPPTLPAGGHPAPAAQMPVSRIEQLQQTILGATSADIGVLRQVIEHLEEAQHVGDTRQLGGRGGRIPGDPQKRMQLLHEIGLPADLTPEETAILLRNFKGMISSRGTFIRQ